MFDEFVAFNLLMILNILGIIVDDTASWNAYNSIVEYLKGFYRADRNTK